MSTLQVSLNSHAAEIKRLLRPALIFIALLWVIEVIDRLFFGGSLDYLGIRPRQLIGLRGILFAPFLHGGFNHLLANSGPLLVLGLLVLLRHKRSFLLISILIILISGLGTWLIGPSQSVHIGASGLIFGYFAFIVVNSWYERSFPAVVLAALVILHYGSIIWGVLPAGGNVSWQGHMFGLIGGVVAAYYVNLNGQVH